MTKDVNSQQSVKCKSIFIPGLMQGLYLSLFYFKDPSFLILHTAFYVGFKRTIKRNKSNFRENVCDTLTKKYMTG